MKKSSRAFTLLEVMISLVLVGILLSFLFSFFRQTLVMQGKAKALKEKIMQRELFQLRIHQLFMQGCKAKKGIFSTIEHASASGPALILSLDQKADPDPTYCGSVHSMLYRNEHRLSLCTWSSNHTAKVDTLLDRVTEFSLSFFNGEEWISSWTPKDGSLPVMIKAFVQREGETLEEFIFFLHPSPTPIIYEEESPG